jgi:hypothetical protein
MAMGILPCLRSWVVKARSGRMRKTSVRVRAKMKAVKMKAVKMKAVKMKAVKMKTMIERGTTNG